MKKRNELKEKIYGCSCQTCKALVRLIDVSRARLVFREKAGGRLCELAVVAESGTAGIAEADVVRKRREYARHLDISLNGKVSNSDRPVHIMWALDHSNHNPDAHNKINLGRAEAVLFEGRFYLR